MGGHTPPILLNMMIQYHCLVNKFYKKTVDLIDKEPRSQLAEAIQGRDLVRNFRDLRFIMLVSGALLKTPRSSSTQSCIMLFYIFL